MPCLVSVWLPATYQTAGVYWSSSVTCIDMKRLAGSGMVTVTGAASRSNTASEYSVSRLGRTIRCLSIGTSSRRCVNPPKPPAPTIPAKFVSDSARLKLSGVTVVCAQAAAEERAIAANQALFKAPPLRKRESTERLPRLGPFAVRRRRPARRSRRNRPGASGVRSRADHPRRGWRAREEPGRPAGARRGAERGRRARRLPAHPRAPRRGAGLGRRRSGARRRALRRHPRELAP